MGSFTGPEVWLFILGQLIVAAGIWGGIRTDLAHIHTRIAEAKAAADAAHRRLDDLLLTNGNGNGDPPHRRSAR